MTDGLRHALPPSADIAERLSRSPLLVALDIDGTLAPIAPTPSEAAVPEATRRTLGQLATLPNVYVAFVTGRGARNGQSMIHLSGAWMIGNHGFELIDPAGALRVNPAAEPYAPLIKKALGELRGSIGAFEGVFLEDKIWTVSIHYRLAKDKDIPELEQLVDEAARRHGLRRLQGKKIFELRPPVDVSKGTALLELAERLQLFQDGALTGSLLYAGDDRTDEDGFRSLRALEGADAVTIHVGTAQLPDGERTAAELLVSDTEEVQQFLEWLTSVRERIPVRA